MAFDAIELEILWSNLISIVSEQAKALQRVAFSPVVREAGDLACALFDRRGRMVAQANTGTPGHINSLATAGEIFIRHFPLHMIEPDDVLITNDPWISAGHLFDITTLTPLYHHDCLIAFAGSTIHHTDIGGMGFGAGARDVHEEGLWIPPMKLYSRGTMDKTLKAILASNVRTPKLVFGDLSAQVASTKICNDQLSAVCERHNIKDIESLADEIIARSEAATRDIIRKLPSGTFHGETSFDVPGGDIITLHSAVTIDNVTGELLIDFAGSSPQSQLGINVVLNYTHAYCTFAVRSTLNPELPNNYGSLAPIKVVAPKGCILNCEYPAPVSGRHVVGMYVPMPVLKALYKVAPDRVIAEGGGAAWTVQIHGQDTHGRAYISSLFGYSGGMGARREKPGLSATCYPTNVAAVSVETLEASTPLEFTQREIRRGSGGKGRMPGGDGEIVSFHVRTANPWFLNALTSRTSAGPEGLEGGNPGEPGRFTVNGKPVSEARKLVLQPDDLVSLETPGGGAYGAS
jgi:N-methylhydantoinase B